MACVPRLVDPAGLDKANGRMIAGQIVGNELAGPAAGGWLFGMSAVLPFAVNASTLGIALLLLLTLPGVFAPSPRPQRLTQTTCSAWPRRENGRTDTVRLAGFPDLGVLTSLPKCGPRDGELRTR